MEFNFIVNNLNLLHKNCITPIQESFDLEDGGGIAITSAYRCMNLNRAMGGNPKSQHTRGYAVDIISYKFPSSFLWNWCFQNLTTWHQLIWEYHERGDFNPGNPEKEFSWVHISYVPGSNIKTSSLSSKREDIHEIYKAEKTKRIGKYTHNIAFANEDYI